MVPCVRESRMLQNDITYGAPPRGVVQAIPELTIEDCRTVMLDRGGGAAHTPPIADASTGRTEIQVGGAGRPLTVRPQLGLGAHHQERYPSVPLCRYP